MHDPEIQSSIFNVKNDGSIDFLINQKTSVQELVKVLFFPGRKNDVPWKGIEPRPPDYKSDVLTTTLQMKIEKTVL